MTAREHLVEGARSERRRHVHALHAAARCARASTEPDGGARKKADGGGRKTADDTAACGGMRHLRAVTDLVTNLVTVLATDLVTDLITDLVTDLVTNLVTVAEASPMGRAATGFSERCTARRHPHLGGGG